MTQEEILNEYCDEMKINSQGRKKFKLKKFKLKNSRISPHMKVHLEYSDVPKLITLYINNVIISQWGKQSINKLEMFFNSIMKKENINTENVHFEYKGYKVVDFKDQEFGKYEVTGTIRVFDELNEAILFCMLC